MKKILSVTLVLVLLFLSIPTHAYAVVPGEDSIGTTNEVNSLTIDELFALRAQLLFNPNATDEDFEQINAQLCSLGVVEISAADVVSKIGADVKPLVEVSDTNDTSWYSKETVVVVWGRQYTVQIITGQFKNQNSPLVKTYDGTRQYNGAQIGAVNAVQVLAEDIVTASISNYIPTVGSFLSASKTLYDVWSEIDSSLSPFSVVEDAAYSFKIQMATTVKLVYAKNTGSPDAGYQILGYVGTRVDYNVGIYIPVYTTENGVPKMEIKSITYSDYSKSYAYDTPDSEHYAANNRRLIDSGATIIYKDHRIIAIPIVIMDQTYRAVVPFSYF